MDSKLKIASISLDITWAEPDSNIAKVEKIMAALPVETDIVVLPELFSTAFVQEREVIEEVAETNGGDTIHKLTEMARRFNMAIAGTFVARTGIHYYNRAFFLEPSGDGVEDIRAGHRSYATHSLSRMECDNGRVL
jgi:predicted amidohydrolase